MRVHTHSFAKLHSQPPTSVSSIKINSVSITVSAFPCPPCLWTNFSKFIVLFGRPNLPLLSLCSPFLALLGYALLCSYLLLFPPPQTGPRGKGKTRAFMGSGILAQTIPSPIRSARTARSNSLSRTITVPARAVERKDISSPSSSSWHSSSKTAFCTTTSSSGTCLRYALGADGSSSSLSAPRAGGSPRRSVSMAVVLGLSVSSASWWRCFPFVWW